MAADGAAKAEVLLSAGHNVVLVLDYGSQYTQLIARRVREIGLLSILLPGDVTMVSPGGRRWRHVRRCARFRDGSSAVCSSLSGRAGASTCAAQERIQGVSPKVVVLSGGPNSVHLEGSPKVPAGFFDYCQQNSIPVLGVCYGMQMIVQLLGGQVETATNGGEYGRMPIDIVPGSSLFSYTSSSSTNVWMSHGDEAVRLPEGFSVVAKSIQVRRATPRTSPPPPFLPPSATHAEAADARGGRGPRKGGGRLGPMRVPARGNDCMGLCWLRRRPAGPPGVARRWPASAHPPLPPARPVQGAIVAIENPASRIYGLQYHPEVMHTEQGTETLRHILLELAGLQADWTMAEVLEETIKMVERQVGGCSLRRWGRGGGRQGLPGRCGCGGGEACGSCVWVGVCRCRAR
jgi:GMP synthase-like glutamine amidotransferase